MSENEPMVKYEQLTEDERYIMGRIWHDVQDGLSYSDIHRIDNIDNTLTDLQNFNLIYCGVLNRYYFTKAGREMMVKRKLADREQAS